MSVIHHCLCVGKGAITTSGGLRFDLVAVKDELNGIVIDFVATGDVNIVLAKVERHTQTGLVFFGGVAIGMYTLVDVPCPTSRQEESRWESGTLFLNHCVKITVRPVGDTLPEALGGGSEFSAIAAVAMSGAYAPNPLQEGASGEPAEGSEYFTEINFQQGAPPGTSGDYTATIVK
ncbi:hypothetical protein GCM10012275_64060 [Longimycelium tulufanense]|uniref:Uncharacterized protein n=1 Tax=Longimycelium tulufanense TaxID=907463 RepID=A0A8J3CJ73_9PSEU|nr:hypothetical protein [Longimycelium tulufanense]GGM84536.1 hypothetical protein GCM10012275_64060 [Longimycelium tulufanense]